MAGLWHMSARAAMRTALRRAVVVAAAGVGVELVDPFQHGGRQRGVRRSEELRSFERFFQLGDLAAGGRAGQLGRA